MSKAKLYRLHEGLPRQAPGSDASTRDAIGRLGTLPPNPRALDVGCGPGRASSLLAELLQARVTAIDIHQPYLNDLAAAAQRAGVGQSIAPRRLSMAKMDFAPASFDLIWAEGSAYFLGIRKSLETWYPLLAAGGAAVFTELCWLGDDRPAEAVEYWATAYPEMTTPAVHLAAAREIGYVACQHWAMPEKDWWADYLTPLEARMKVLTEEAKRDRKLSALIADSRRAIDLYRRYSSSFGYVFHLVRKP